MEDNLARETAEIELEGRVWPLAEASHYTILQAERAIARATSRAKKRDEPELGQIEQMLIMLHAVLACEAEGFGQAYPTVDAFARVLPLREQDRVAEVLRRMGLLTSTDQPADAPPADTPPDEACESPFRGGDG